MKLYDEEGKYVGEFVSDSLHQVGDSFDDGLGAGCLSILVLFFFKFPWLLVLVLILIPIWLLLKLILKGIFLLLKYALKGLWWLVRLPFTMLFWREFPEF